MPPPSSQRADIEPPDQVTYEAVKGFATGALRFGTFSILAHMILILPHPLSLTVTGPPATESQQRPPRGRSILRPRLIYRPLQSLSESLAPASRVYRGLTPQFKVFLQIAAMTLGGCVWAERRVTEYMEAVRRLRRAERHHRAPPSDKL